MGYYIALQISPKVGKKQEICGSRTRVAGLSDIIVRLGGSSLAGEASWREAQRRDSLDKILNKVEEKEEEDKKKEEKEDDDKKKEDKEDEKRKEELARSWGLKRRKGDPTAFKSKRMRPNAANTLRQDVTVKEKQR